MFSSCLKKLEGAVDIGVDVEARICDGWSHPGTGCKVADTVESPFREKRIDELGVSDASFNEADAIKGTCQVSSFYRRVVEVVEAVQDGHFMAILAQAVDEVRADEARSSCNKHAHKKLFETGLLWQASTFRQGIFSRSASAHPWQFAGFASG